MTTMSGIQKLYDRLTPEERFRATIAAYQRHDHQEARRLKDSAPDQDVRTPSPQFFERMRAFQTLTFLHGMFIRDCLMQTLAAFVGAYQARLKTVTGGSTDDEALPLEQVVDAVCKTAAYQHAWATLCAELGVDPDQPMAKFGAVANLLESIVDEPPDELEPDEEYLAMLRGNWDHALSRVAKLK